MRIEVLLDIVSKVDIVLPGMDEGRFLFGDFEPKVMAQKFFNQGAKQVVLKMGAKGAYYLTKKDAGFVDAFPVSRVVDPVGAGDSFAAGFLSGLLDELSFRNAVERGAAVGAMVTVIAGDVEGLPKREKLESFFSGAERVDFSS